MDKKGKEIVSDLTPYSDLSHTWNWMVFRKCSLSTLSSSPLIGTGSCYFKKGDSIIFPLLLRFECHKGLLHFDAHLFFISQHLTVWGDFYLYSFSPVSVTSLCTSRPAKKWCSLPCLAKYDVQMLHCWVISQFTITNHPFWLRNNVCILSGMCICAVTVLGRLVPRADRSKHVFSVE